MSLESSHKGEFSGGKSLESSTEYFTDVLVNHLWDEPSMSEKLPVLELPDGVPAFWRGEKDGQGKGRPYISACSPASWFEGVRDVYLGHFLLYTHYCHETIFFFFNPEEKDTLPLMSCTASET